MGRHSKRRQSGAVRRLPSGRYQARVRDQITNELVSIGTLLAFIIVCAGVWVLRKTDPNLPRPFRTPFVWVVAPLGIVTCGAMMAWLPWDTWVRLAIWSIIGLAIYFLYSIRHAKPPRWKLIEQPAAE